MLLPPARAAEPSETSQTAPTRKRIDALRAKAEAFYVQSKFADAEPLFAEAADGYASLLGKAHPTTVAVLSRLASVYEAEARYSEAEQFARSVVGLREQSLPKDDPATFAAVNNLAQIVSAQGRYDEAEALYLRAMNSSEQVLGPDHPHRIAYTINLAHLFYLREQYAKAEPLYRSALAAAERSLGSDHPFTLATINNLAKLYAAEGRYKDAEPLYLQGISACERVLGRDHVDTLSIMANYAAMLSDQGRHAEAQTLFLAVLNTQLRTVGPNYIDLAWTYRGLGTVLSKGQRDPDKAIFFLKQAVNTLQTIRANLSTANDGSHSAFVKVWAQTYFALQKLMIEKGRFSEAEQVGRMLKETEYFALLRGTKGDMGGKALAFGRQEQAWALQLASWSDRPNKLAREIDRLRAKQAAGAALTPLDTKQLSDLNGAYDQAYSRYRETITIWLGGLPNVGSRQIAEEARALEVASSERLQSVVAGIGPDVALLQIVSFDDGLHLFLTTPGGFKHVGTPVRRTDLFAAIFDARNELERAGLADVAGDAVRQRELKVRFGKLYDMLLRPIETDLADAGTKTLMLNLQGKLRYVPFAALWDGKAWLTERMALALYTPAAQTRFESPRAMDGANAFGVSLATQGFPALPAVPRELETIIGAKGPLHGSVALNDRFTRAALEAGLAAPRPILHIASHFAMRPGDEANSFLLLGDGTHLTLTDINRSPRLRFRGVELITLSACETALGGDGNGMEIEGLGALVQNKGAGSVMATLWSVVDETTASFMVDFYQGVAARRLDKAEAIRQAQLKMIHSVDNNDPWYWAPFVLMGNWK